MNEEKLQACQRCGQEVFHVSGLKITCRNCGREEEPDVLRKLRAENAKLRYQENRDLEADFDSLCNLMVAVYAKNPQKTRSRVLSLIWGLDRGDGARISDTLQEEGGVEMIELAAKRLRRELEHDKSRPHAPGHLPYAYVEDPVEDLEDAQEAN